MVQPLEDGEEDELDDPVVEQVKEYPKSDVSAGSATGADAAGNLIQNINQSAGSSMEQFISPIQITKGHSAGASTPGFRSPEVGGEIGKYGGGGQSIGPTVNELDPYFPTILNEGADDGTRFMVDNDYRFVVNDSVTGGDGDFNLRTLEDASPGSRENISVVRPMSALRGPLIISGWGYGMDDFPVPNQGMNWPNRGKFDEGLVHNRALWKTGPVHLMWDDERQVWQGGYPIVCGVVVGAITAPVDVCSPTSFYVNLLRNTQEDEKGRLSDVVGETITVQNRDPSLEQEDIPNAVFCMAIKLNYEWLPLWVGCPETPACGGEGQPEVPKCIGRSVIGEGEGECPPEPDPPETE